MTSALTLPSDGLPAASRLDPQPGTTPLPHGADEVLTRNIPGLIAVRRHLHAHPELSGQEFRTTALVAGRLTGLGLVPRLLPKGNGLFCDIVGGADGPLVAFRADLDALPLPDSKSVDYRSTVPGVCHACGHDVHTTVLLGLAPVLVRLAEQGALPGRVRLIFQPAEESVPSGAPEVIAAGALDGVSSIFALHCAPQFPVGTVAVRSGPLTAASATLEVRVAGGGGHTARPHLTTHVVDLLGRVIVGLPGMLAHRMDPRRPVSLVWGAVSAGTAFNTIPAEGAVRGTVRSLSREAWHEAGAVITNLVPDLVAGSGADVEVSYVEGFPPVINDHHATALIASAATRALGVDQVVEAPVSMGGEDFSFYLEQVPGAMIRLGVTAPGVTDPPDTHQTGFDVDERAIECGVRVMAHTALAKLADSGREPGNGTPR
ncbi:amidohydrolase [Micromonospora sp. WMMD998]|uniref:amidohydrolase n=1 Tax=Micromonospora sp. WMMD998 TaxID=3016092 RepID=UPI00249B0297|nr:amidohydrolase [Micromonospora sp. WMMD998]WFE38388.1 amidohydrolase [Micromonospora sp. WMMD998]